MAWMLKALKGLLTYKEPKEEEGGFEFLENQNEGINIDVNQLDWQKIEQIAGGGDKNAVQSKPPLPIGEWNRAKSQGKQQDSPDVQSLKNGMIASKLAVNIEFIRQRFNLPKNQDILLREFNIAKKTEACLIFVDGMVDKTIINQFILPELMDPANFEKYNNGLLLDYIIKNVIPINEVTKEKDFQKIIDQILNGITALFIDGCEEALLIESKGFEKRNVDKPLTENVVIGSQEAFTENLRTNITLIRRIIKNEKLITEIIPVGNRNRINCAIMYIEGIVNATLLNEVKRRLKNINIDFIGGSGMLEQLIEDNPLMLLPQVVSTERPDRMCSFIMEGQVGIICDGTPFALAVPVTFSQLLHSAEDSMLRWQFGSFIRLVRIVGILLSMLLPGMYIALTLFHREIIPTPLLMTIVQTRESVPFHAIIEIIFMEVAFELIREGGIRMPWVTGQTLGIIGALILGQAAVAAGLVSPILIIIVAVTGLGSFATPNYSMGIAVRILRYVFIFWGALFGLNGISFGLVVLTAYICHMKSFGVPFFSPVAPKTKTTADVLFRQPIWKQKIRPDYLNTPDRNSTGNDPRIWKN